MVSMCDHSNKKKIILKLCYSKVALHFIFPRTVSEVTVSHIDDPTHFFIQHNDAWEQIEALGSKLNEFFQVR